MQDQTTPLSVPFLVFGQGSPDRHPRNTIYGNDINTDMENTNYIKDSSPRTSQEKTSAISKKEGVSQLCNEASYPYNEARPHGLTGLSTIRRIESPSQSNRHDASQVRAPICPSLNPETVTQGKGSQKVCDHHSDASNRTDSGEYRSGISPKSPGGVTPRNLAMYLTGSQQAFISKAQAVRSTPRSLAL